MLLQQPRWEIFVQTSVVAMEVRGHKIDSGYMLKEEPTEFSDGWMLSMRERKESRMTEESGPSNLKDKLAINWNGKAVNVVSFKQRWGVPYRHVEIEVSLRPLSRMLNLNFGRNILAEVINLGVVNMSL